MAKEFEGLSPERLSSVAQSLVEARSRLSSVISVLDAIEPLSTDSETKELLTAVKGQVDHASHRIQILYRKIAQEASQA